MNILGIDIGGSGIKGAPIDTTTGELLGLRQRVATPQPSRPEDVAEVVGQVARAFDWKGPIGCGFPAVVQNGTVLTAANISKKWIGANAVSLFNQATGCPTWVVNDADAAGTAEMALGAGRGRKGSVLIVTIGTGLGTALFINGHLVPNLELGHIEIDGEDAELRASDAARKREELSWKKWGKRFNKYLTTLERLLNPELIILGGGTSKDFEKFAEFISIRAEVMPAQLLNEAGLVGAAMAARDHLRDLREAAPDEDQPPYPDGPQGGEQTPAPTLAPGEEVEEEMESDPTRPQVEENTFEVIDPHKEMT
ncbi:MAG: polyphosphate--glucose phosphotransferase, partial [Chloroflexota bacterium]